jgi:hypothetical protein
VKTDARQKSIEKKFAHAVSSMCSRFKSSLTTNLLGTYLSIQALTTSVSFFLVWLSQYFGSEDLNLVERLSFKVVDPPWLPSGIQPVPIIGNHYFGDWQLDTTWSIDKNNPYISEYMPSRTPPFGLLLTRLFGELGIKTGFFVFLFVTSLLVAQLILKSTKKWNFQSRVFFFLFAFFFNVGVIFSFDRGSSHVFVFACLGLFVVYGLEQKLIASSLYFFVATGFKPQVMIVVIIFIGIFSWKRIFALVLMPFLLNFLALITFFHPIKSSFFGYLQGSSLLTNGGGNESAAGIIADSFSIVGFFSRMIEAINQQIGSSIDWIENSSTLFLALAFFWFSMVTFVVWKFHVSWFVRLVLVFSLCSLLLPSSHLYTLSWSFTALCLIAHAGTQKLPCIKQGNQLTFLQASLICLVFLSIVTPTFFVDFWIPGISRRLPLSILYFPLLVILVGNLFFIYSKSIRIRIS